MKRMRFNAIIVTVALSLVVLASGCSCPIPIGGKGCAQLGETEAQGQRRHLRNARINHAQMLADLDTFWLYDEPSTLTEYSIP